MPSAPKQTFLRAKLSDGSTVEFDSEPLASGGEKVVFFTKDKQHVIAFFYGQLTDPSERRRRLEKILGAYSRLLFVETPSNPVMQLTDLGAAIDAGKMQRELQWKPAFTFESGVAQTVAWYLDNKGWWERIRSGEYARYYEQQYGAR